MPCNHQEFHKELSSLLNQAGEPPPPEGNFFVNDCDELKCVVRFCTNCCVICTVGFILAFPESYKLAASITDDMTIESCVFPCRMPNGAEVPVWLTAQDVPPIITRLQR